MVDYGLGEYLSPWVYEAPVSIISGVSPSLAGVAVIEDYTFPLSVDAGVPYSIRLLVHNVGTDGIIAGGIVNDTGNPGSFTIISESGETIIDPGQYLRSSTTSPVVNCTTIEIIRSIRFSTQGTYTVKLWAMHEEDGSWFYDQEVPLVVTVTVGAPYSVPVHVFDNVLLKAEWWDTMKQRSNSIINIDASLLIGAKIDYMVKYVDGTPLAEIANIALDGANIVNVSLSKGEAKSGTIDLTGRIGSTVTITISFESFPGFWSDVLFDIWIILNYSEPPPSDPTVPFNWSEFIDKYGKLVALGGGAILLISLMRPPGQPIIVIPGGGKK